ncbi:hypothetical protein [Glycomyces salinus]|uniref:hypothetical protein n=1 Tax=Glycomyces salinus TaxID=980294 RepID=UPI0018EA7B46|nr:hypothetical protein [Glycomyces salinus]
MEQPELEALADAITAVANRRSRIPQDRLLRETALNILIMTRIASNRLPDLDQREAIESTCGRLTDLLRDAAQCFPSVE